MAVPVNSIVSVIYRMDWQEQRMMLTLTYRVTANTSADTLIGDLNSINTFFADGGAGLPALKFFSVIPQNVDVLYVQSQVIRAPRSVYRQRAINSPGLWAADATTGNLAGIITLKTDLAGRSQVSNKHIGPLPENGYVNGSLTDAYRTALIDFAAELIQTQAAPAAGATTITLAPVIYHKSSLSDNYITTQQVSTRVGTMRRRTLRVGE